MINSIEKQNLMPKSHRGQRKQTGPPLHNMALRGERLQNYLRIQTMEWPSKLLIQKKKTHKMKRTIK
jgi:hypothetical protein